MYFSDYRTELSEEVEIYKMSISMKYYFLELTSDAGIFPQIQSMKNAVHVDDAKSVYNIPYGEKCNVQPDLGDFVVEEHAELTDFLSCAMLFRGYIVSQKALKILTALPKEEVEIYPCRIRFKGALLDSYFWVRWLSYGAKYLDFNRICFKETNFRVTEVFNQHSFLNYEELVSFLDQKPTMHKLLFDKLYFSELIANHDVFDIRPLNSSVIVSQRIVDQLVDAEVSGCKFKLAN